ncbi:MAG: ATP-binding cassette domain-containing protein [alpha proteobacterium HIMB59]|nr:MAG: ATP-binding cassette domain-containing protein [alpha proteobacterium HIMB59]
MNLIELKKISKSYKTNIGSFEILKNINFKIDKKKSIFLFGPSGCGKSTLLNIITGLDVPDKGSILYEGKAVKENHMELLKKDIGIIFQDHYLISELNVIDNIKLKHQNISEINEILNYFKIDDLKLKFPNQLSNGQKQRVCVARAMVSRPKLLIADEPTSYLDRENADLVINLILDACKNFDLSTVIASHDISFKSNFDYSYTIESNSLIKC